MEDKQMTVPYVVYESSMARMERHNKRLVVALIIAVIMICLSNLAWLYMWSSYEYVGESTAYEQDGGGVNIIGDRNQYEPKSSESNKISKEEER